MTTRLLCAVLSAALALPLLSGCMLGPDYKRPAAPAPAAYKELAGWKAGAPADAIDRGAWWSIYRDPVLDGLERQVDVSNQTLRASEAALRQARAVVSEARASLFPTLSADAGARVRQSLQSSGGGRTIFLGSGSGGITLPSGSTGSGTSLNNIKLAGGGAGAVQYNLSTAASWDLDVWGRIRRTIESDVASAQASAADLASARLSIQAELASTYFSLRARDAQKRLLDETAKSYAESLRIARNQYRAGIVARGDVVSAETQLRTAQSQAIAEGVQRAQFEHAIAVLIGKPPASFSLPPAPLATDAPVAPVDVPSALLERRPDIAAAERRMAAANAQVGVARSAYFPDITLSGTFGYSSSTFNTLLKASNGVWSIGADVAETLIDFGARRAQVAQARAAYEQTVADYRQTVLTGFQQVEDQLAALNVLAQQAEVQAQAVAAAREATRLELNQYRAGTAPFTSVITAQQNALSNEQTALTILESRLTASVGLIQSLGGGWHATALAREG